MKVVFFVVVAHADIAPRCHCPTLSLRGTKQSPACSSTVRMDRFVPRNDGR